MVAALYWGKRQSDYTFRGLDWCVLDTRKNILLGVVVRFKALSEIKVIDDPESKSALALNVLPPGPASETLAVIMRMSGGLVVVAELEEA